MRKQIDKLATLTLRRIGLFTGLFLCMSFFFSFLAISSYIEVSKLKGKPYEIFATTDTPVDLSSLIYKPSIVQATPFIRLVCQIRFGEKEEQMEVKAVLSSFLDRDLISGTVFPDSSSMPYLVINRAAAKKLMDEHNQTPNSLMVGEEVQIKITDYLPAVICGVYEDGSELPAIYMNYELALDSSNSSAETQICVLVKDAGSIQSAIRELQKSNLKILTSLESVRVEWTNQLASFWRITLCALGFFICAVTLSNKDLQVELIQHWNEIKILLLSGFSTKELKALIALRMSLVSLVDIMISSFLAWYVRRFSLLGIGCNILLSSVAVVASITASTFSYRRTDGY